MRDSEADAMEDEKRKNRRTRGDEENRGAGEFYIESGLGGRTKCSHIGETW